MNLHLDDLVIDLNEVDINDVYDCWNWCLKELKSVIMISKLGDIFFEASDRGVYWLSTEDGSLKKISKDPQEFIHLLKDEENLNIWFFPSLIEKLIAAGKSLAQNQIYSFIKMPILGGEYNIDNIEMTDISVHFALTGQICEQIRNLPDGTAIKINLVK